MVSANLDVSHNNLILVWLFTDHADNNTEGRQVLKYSFDLFTYERAVLDFPNEYVLTFCLSYFIYRALNTLFIGARN